MLLAVSPSVPQSPPVEDAIGPFYERFDGFEPWGFDAASGYEPVSEGWNYGDSPRPGQLNTDATDPAGVYGKVGSVGASPYPVYNPMHKVIMETQHFDHPTTQFRLGPGAQAPGLQNTLTSTEITQNPPQPGDLASIIAGLG